MISKVPFKYLLIVSHLFILIACKEKNKPEADFTYEIDTQSVKFTSTSSNALTLSWDFGDGGSSGGPTAIHRYLKSGTYQVNLKASNIDGSSSKTKEVKINATKCYVTKMVLDSITLINSSMDLYYVMAIKNGSLLESSVQHWDDLHGYPISNYYFWEFPNRSNQFYQYVDETSTIKFYWTKQVPTTLMQEINFNPVEYTKGANAYPSFITLEKFFNGSLLLKLRIFVIWE